MVNNATLFTLDIAPTSIEIDDTTIMTLTIDNTGIGDALSNANFTLNLPSGVVVADVPNAQNNGCGGTFSPVALASVVSFSGGSLGADSICDLVVTLKGTTGGMKPMSGSLNVLVGSLPVTVASNGVVLNVAYDTILTEQILLHRLQTNYFPNGWTYVLADFLTPDRIRLVVIINGEVGVVELTIAPATSAPAMQWSVASITNTSGGATSAEYAELARRHVMVAFAQAINAHVLSFLGTANHDILDYEVLPDGLRLRVVGQS